MEESDNIDLSSELPVERSNIEEYIRLYLQKYTEQEDL